MRRRAAFLALAGLALGAGAAAAGSFSDSAAGTSGAQFLTLGAGARAAAMGEAFSAAAADATAVRYNPAAMLRVEENALSFMHVSHLESAFLDHAAFVRRLGASQAVGASLLYMSFGGVTKRDAIGFETGTAHPADLALTAAYAARAPLPGPLAGGSLGVTLGFVQSKIVASATSLTGSFGWLSRPYGERRTRAAFVAENLFGSLKFDRSADPLPLTLRLGAASHLAPGWLVSVEAAAPRDADPFGAVGVEKWVGGPYERGLALRAGLNTRTLGDVAGLTGFSAGLGFALTAATLDYALVPFGDLGWTHRVSVSLRFGRAGEAAEADPAAARGRAAPADPYAAQLERARAAVAANRSEAAAAEYAKAVALKADDPAARLEYGRVLMTLKRWEEAGRQWQAAQGLLPAGDERQVLALERLGAVAARKPDMKRAKRRYLEAILLAKTLGTQGEEVGNAYLGLATCLETEKSFKDALKNYRKAMDQTTDPEAKERIRKRIEALERK